MKYITWILLIIVAYFSFGIGYMVAENKYYDMTKAVLDETAQSRKESAELHTAAQKAMDIAELIIRLSKKSS